MREPLTSTIRIARRASGADAAARMVPEETPVALSYAGTTHAVMMASPADLEDFALGFSLTEGIISSPGEVETIDIVADAGAGPKSERWRHPSIRSECRRPHRLQGR